MSAFVPPYPERSPRPLSVLQLLRRARRNILEIFTEADFRYEFMQGRLLARSFFVCNGPDSVRHVLSTHGSRYERKSPQQRHALAPLVGDGLIISDGEIWRRRRQAVAPAVHASRLPVFAPVMIEAIVAMRDRWAGLPDGAEIDVLAAMAELTAEIICRTIFGRELGQRHADTVVREFSAYQRAVGRLDVLSLLSLPDWVPRPRRPSLHRSVARIHQVLDDIVADHRRRDGRESSVLDELRDARDETGARLDEVALRNEAAVIFLAGHETTATTLAWAWYLLSQAGDVEARLHAELDAVLGSRLPSLADLPRLPFLRAILSETLRLYPPIPVLAREALDDDEIRGRRIPRGSTVMVVPWLLHRHEKLWREPDAFRPERFLPGSTEPVSKFAYVPFAIGPRICAGLAFGAAEAALSLAVLSQAFRLRLKAGHVVAPVCRLTLRPSDTLPMLIERRTR